MGKLYPIGIQNFESLRKDGLFESSPPIREKPFAVYS